MKKLFCVLFLLLLCLAFPVCAESSVSVSSNEDVKLYLEQYLSAEFDYCDIVYNENLNSFYVGLSTDGLTKNVVEWLKNGKDETYEPWVQIKESVLEKENSIIDYYKSIGREDLHVMVSLLNDDAYMRNDYSSISINPLFCVTNNSAGYYNAVVTDCMAEFSKAEVERIEYSAADGDFFISSLQAALESQFDYCKVRYLGDSKYVIVIDIGFDGLTNLMKQMLQAGCDANYEPWVQCKESYLSFYDEVMNVIEKAETNGFCKVGTALHLNLINDNIKLRNDYGVLSASTFLTISDRTIYFDYLGEMNGY